MRPRKKRDPASHMILRPIYISAQQYEAINDWIDRAWRAGMYGTSKSLRGRRPSWAQWSREALEARWRREQVGNDGKRVRDEQLMEVARSIDAMWDSLPGPDSAVQGEVAPESGSPDSEAPGAAEEPFDESPSMLDDLGAETVAVDSNNQEDVI